MKIYTIWDIWNVYFTEHSYLVATWLHDNLIWTHVAYIQETFTKY